jgi:hypothetical protein
MINILLTAYTSSLILPTFIYIKNGDKYQLIFIPSHSKKINYDFSRFYFPTTEALLFLYFLALSAINNYKDEYFSNNLSNASSVP